MFNRFIYIAEEVVDSIRKNLILAVAAVTVIAVTMGILGFVVMAWNMSSNMIKNAERKVGEINVYLVDTVTEDERLAFQQFLVSIPEIDKNKIEYLSKEQALEEFKQTYADHPELWQHIDTSPLPATFKLHAVDPKNVGLIISKISEESPNPEIIEEIRAASAVIEKLENIFNQFSTLGTIIVVILCLVSVLLVSVTIQAAIFARRREIAIMKLVGATNWFIRWPFVLEGVAEGVVGASFATIVILIMKVYVLDRFSEALSFLRLSVSPGLLLYLILAIIMGGILIGAVGSAVALRRFLDV